MVKDELPKKRIASFGGVFSASNFLKC